MKCTANFWLRNVDDQLWTKSKLSLKKILFWQIKAYCIYLFTTYLLNSWYIKKEEEEVTNKTIDIIEKPNCPSNKYLILQFEEETLL